MHTPQTRVHLENCRTALAAADASDEMRQLASNLIDQLVEMHDAHRMRVSVLLLALDSLELVPGLETAVNKLRATAAREQASNE